MNAYFNTLETVSSLQGFVPESATAQVGGSRTKKNAFYAFANRICGKKVAVVGHFPNIEQELAGICELT
ncbi:MAG: Rossmann-like domain-containing protein, partial [Sporomusa sp.]